MDRGFFAWCMLAATLATGAAAQTAPAPATAPGPAVSAPDPLFEAAKLAFEALPETGRKALQDGLVWTGDFQGVTSGTFGRRTYEGINAYAKRLKLPAIGSLDEKARAMLERAANTAKVAAGFGQVAEKRSGASIGVPAKLLPVITAKFAGQSFSASDGSAVLDTFAYAGADADLKAQFDKLSTDNSSRKITYKLLRPDFFVVTGEAAGHTYYTRMAAGLAGGVPALRGFNFNYATPMKASMDRMTIAIANSFDPGFGGAGAAPVAGAAGTPPVASPPVVAAPKPVLSATGLAISATQVLVALPLAGCTDPMAGKARARVVKADKASGLTLLEASATALPGLAASPAAFGEVIVIAFDATGSLSATTGETIESSPVRLRAALQGGATGGVMLDRSGTLAGFVEPQHAGNPATFPVISGKAALAFAGVGEGTAASTPKSTGEIVAMVRAAIVPVSCTR